MATKFKKYFKKDPNKCDNPVKAIMPDKVCLMINFENGYCIDTKKLCPFVNMETIINGQ